MRDSVTKLSQQNLSAILKAFGAMSQARIAEEAGISEPTLSAYKKDHLERITRIVSACNLKLVPIEEETYSRAEISAIKLLARKGLGDDSFIPIAPAAPDWDLIPPA